MVTTQSREREGSVAWNAPGLKEPCSTWYKVFGDVNRTDRTPVVVVHGGPGAHEYLLNFKVLMEQYDVPIIFYDQVGCGHSSHLTDKNGNEDFWTLELFKLELNTLIDHLDIRHKGFDIVGQSWGSMLGAAFATDVPSGLRRLVLSSGLADSKDWHTAAIKLRARLPERIRDVLNKGEAEGTTDSKEYKEALEEFYLRHVCKSRPFPHPSLAIALEHMKNDSEVCMTMWGPSEIELTGSLRSFSIGSRLPNINAPVLLLNGEDDECQPEMQMTFSKAIKQVRWFEFAGASHAIHLEQPEKYFKVISDFLLEEGM